MKERHRTRSFARRLCERLSYANVISTIAVFGVLAAGSAYAAATIGAGDIKKNAVRSKHIRNKAVSTAKLADGAVTGRKLADGAVGGSKLAAGIPHDIEIVSGSSLTNSADKSAQVACPAGKLAIGGGAASPSGSHWIRGAHRQPSAEERLGPTAQHRRLVRPGDRSQRWLRTELGD